ncbi:MAG: antiterminator LoaP [Oribacterium sp.]|nr:antiterminator LoaP [Oribacterium sp.]
MIYVMQVLTGEEAEVRQNLTAFVLHKGEEVFYPTYEKFFRSHGKYELRMARLFPGYLFIRSEEPIDFYNRVRLVKNKHFMETLTKLLRVDVSIIPLSGEEEKAILELIGKQYEMKMSRGVIQDGRLVIQSGPLTGREAGIVRIDRHKRIAILRVHMMGRDIETKVGLEVVEK